MDENFQENTSQNQNSITLGGCHDETDADWLVIRGPLKGHKDTPFGWPTSGWPSSERIWCFQLLLISNVIS
jgi:hypothetical protein